MSEVPEVDQDQDTDEVSGVTKDTVTISEEISKHIELDVEIGKTDDGAKEVGLGLTIHFGPRSRAAFAIDRGGDPTHPGQGYGCRRRARRFGSAQVVCL